VGEEIEVVKEIKYVGVVLDSRGKWEKERKQVVIRGKSALNSINICEETRRWREELVDIRFTTIEHRISRSKF
jgi:cobalamin-dependent methionine synthase I